MAMDSLGIKNKNQINQTNTVNNNSNAINSNSSPSIMPINSTASNSPEDTFNSSKDNSAQVISMVTSLVDAISQLDDANISDDTIKSYQSRLQMIQMLAGDNVDVNSIIQNAIKNLSDKNKAKIEQILGVKEDDGIKYNYAPINDFQVNVLSKLPASAQKAVVQSSNAINSAISDQSIGSIKTSENGNKLANIANQTAKDMSSMGWCLKGVNNSLEKMYGFRLSYDSAYKAADALAQKTDLFKETHVSKDDLSKLPAGAIVVWDKNEKHPYGHISIALGNGYEASDHIAQQYKNISDSYRVFVPN